MVLWFQLLWEFPIQSPDIQTIISLNFHLYRTTITLELPSLSLLTTNRLSLHLCFPLVRSTQTSPPSV